ncbi:MAG TPA: gamma-glutamyltransferase [Thermoanaerobaculia bacterium]|nr:gamma-glutamyltransferase [Thermoanaerobaculia bacterium]
MRSRLVPALVLTVLSALPLSAQMRTEKPPLHGSHWMAVTGKPMAATAGAMIFERGGNAVDAAAAMIAATCTMWDTLSWGGETQALIYDPHQKKVIGINALGVAPTGATPEFYKSKGFKYPPEYGPLAAVTPGTPGGIITMIAEYGKLSLKEDLAPAIEMADGYAIEAQAANIFEAQKARIKQWPYSKAVMLPHLSGAPARAGEGAGATQNQGPTPEHDRPVQATTRGTREAPEPGEMFRQPDLAAMLRKLVDAEQQALKKGKSRKEAIDAAYDRFYKGDIAKEIARGVQEQGGLITESDLANWKVHIEEPLSTNYRGVDVYKLREWTQGPAMLATLNILENFDLKSMGFNTSRYINTVYQAMSLAFADRDFYYGDIYTPPVEPILGLMSKDYARERAKLINPIHNDPNQTAGDPYPYQRETNPFLDLLQNWPKTANKPGRTAAASTSASLFDTSSFYAGTTSVEAADTEGWVVSVTPSGGWPPAVIAGHSGVGLSQRAQSFVLDPAENPFNVIEPGKHPRVTLTPTLALKNGKPFLCFSVQGGDSQDQNLIQFFLDIVEFGFTVQEATEAPNFNTFQMRSSFGNHEIEPGRILLNDQTPPYVRSELRRMGYTATYEERTSGPINAILFDLAHGTFWGGSSNHGEDYGIGW